jgi:NADPH:quinone reductase-like Zn-dependent oxidoreductase
MATMVELDKPSIPRTMRAAALDRFGGPDVLTIHELPVPVVAANEVLIAVHVAGVGGWDADMRDGWSPSGRRPRFPLVLGSDGSGVVAARGARVRRFQIGDPVYAFAWDSPKGGFYAEYVVVPAADTAPMPRSLDVVAAGAMPVTGLTALEGIDDALHVRKGEAVIIHGASGGVGTLAVQFAKLRGARVFASASGQDGVALVRQLGADAAADGHGDITGAVRQFAPDGVDAVLALTGAGLPQCLDMLTDGGRVAYPKGVTPAPRKRRGVEVIGYDGEPGTRQFARLNRAVDAIRLQVPIAAEFPLAEAAAAHRRLAEGHVLGKIVLRARAS